jgi:hypothetical protein
MRYQIIGDRDLPDCGIIVDLAVGKSLTDAPRHQVEDFTSGTLDPSGSQTLVG